MHQRGGDGTDDGRLGIATQGGLEDAGELGVSVGDVAAYNNDGREGLCSGCWAAEGERAELY